MASVGVGIDVSKATLDFATSDGARSGSVTNDVLGLRELLRFLSDVTVGRVVLEASGGYEREALLALYEAGLSVVLIQPARARHFARAIGKYAKTDAIDARVLAQMAQVAVDDVVLWEPTDELLADLRALVDRRRILCVARDAERKRLRLARGIVREDIEDSVSELTARIDKLESQIDELIESSVGLREQVEVLEQVPGVARVTATSLLVFLPELGTLSRSKIVALAGLAPMNRDSGGWSGQRFIQGGRKNARNALYMPVVSGLRWNPVIKSHYEHLRKQGKLPKVALVACMRKLLLHLNSQMREYLEGPTPAVPQNCPN